MPYPYFGYMDIGVSFGGNNVDELVILSMIVFVRANIMWKI